LPLFACQRVTKVESKLDKTDIEGRRVGREGLQCRTGVAIPLGKGLRYIVAGIIAPLGHVPKKFIQAIKDFFRRLAMVAVGHTFRHVVSSGGQESGGGIRATAKEATQPNSKDSDQHEASPIIAVRVEGDSAGSSAFKMTWSSRSRTFESASHSWGVVPATILARRVSRASAN
jgi:hypothetical protein